MRRFRRSIEAGLPFVATMIAMFAIADPLGFSSSLRVFVGVAGLLLLQASVWKLANPLLPDDRRHHALRGEGDHFIELLRQLNRAALAAEGAGRSIIGDPEVEEVREQMHAAVDRMVKVAVQSEG